MFYVLLGSAGLAFVALVGGFAWALAERGRVTRRSGPEVHAELVEREIARESRLRGESVVSRQVWAGGTGHSVESSATYSTDEIVQAFRSGRLRPIAPGLLLVAGLFGLLVFGGLALLVRPGALRLVGLGLLVLACYGSFQFVSGLRAAAERSQPPGSPLSR
jgi:hypothetical protein